jgi:hypothetical protein
MFVTTGCAPHRAPGLAPPRLSWGERLPGQRLPREVTS